MSESKNVGVALGGGGVRGLAHVAVLQTLDARGIRPAALAGTSMGAIIAALYASGKSGRKIRNIVEQHVFTRNDGLRDVYEKRRGLFKWFTMRPAWGRGGLLKPDGFLQYLIDQMNMDTFDELKIPLHIVATDFYSGNPVVFTKGPLFPALKASMSIPGVFVPVEHDGKILVDGGISNNLPYDLLADGCDTTIAIDVALTRERKSGAPPNMIDATLGMFEIMVERLTQTKVAAHPPTIYFRPRLTGMRILEFDKVDDVFEQSSAAMKDFESVLRRNI